MRNLLAILPLVLFACTPMAENYSPVVDIDALNGVAKMALASDEGHCRVLALAYKPPLSVSAIGGSAGQGALTNATAAAVSPSTAAVIVGVGAAGAGVSELLSELGLRGPQQIKIFVHCLSERGRKSGLYSIVDPNL